MLRIDTRTMLERKLGYGEGQALALAIEGGFKVGNRLERKLARMLGNDIAAYNYVTAMETGCELSDATKTAIVSAFGNIHGSDMIEAVEPGDEPEGCCEPTDVTVTIEATDELYGDCCQ